MEHKFRDWSKISIIFCDSHEKFEVYNSGKLVRIKYDTLLQFLEKLGEKKVEK